MAVLDENLEEMESLGGEMDLLAVSKETACVSVHYEPIEAVDHIALRWQL